MKLGEASGGVVTLFVTIPTFSCHEFESRVAKNQITLQKKILAKNEIGQDMIRRKY